jgi:hypothetical protein
MPTLSAPSATPVGQVICAQPGAYSFLGTKATTSTFANGAMRLSPIWVPEPVTLDRIGCEITAASTDVGATARLVIYTDTGQIRPDVVLLNAGTVAADSTGVKEITISQALSPGTYWLGAVIQGAPTSTPTLRAADERVVPAYIFPAGPSGTLAAQADNTVTGALPSPWTSSGSSGGMVRVFVRAV